MVSVSCTGAALCRSTGLLQPHYSVIFLCNGLSNNVCEIFGLFNEGINC